MKITVVIVVCNKDFSQSSVCENIRPKGDIDVVVVDNSTLVNHNREYCEKNQIGYYSMNGNKGLSKAYNAAIDMFAETDVIVLLDDDTDVTSDYFDNLKKELENRQDVDIFVPIIKGQDGVIYSPNNYNFLKNKLVKSPMIEVKQKSFNAISSCMAIRMRVFDNYRYNEKLFVDEIDHCFCREQRELGRKFGILNVEINQNFHQRGEGISASSAWNRVKIRIVDIFRHARLMGGGKYIFWAFIKCNSLGVQIGKKSKSLKVMIKSALLSTKLIFADR
ncbi:glycosyltransferase [uncultured Acetatifactor sp.]|uniref:glycosyltransferase n=1 Tax=uncultured Acetatifactor sp. TaxID=1671927 RepID=UPI002612C887|nr:glycosyltransferase [uncultured Acetatifactor sp.]